MRNLVIIGSLVFTFWLLSSVFTTVLECRPTYMTEQTKFNITAVHMVTDCETGETQHMLRVIKPDPELEWRLASWILTPATEEPEALVLYWEAPGVLRYKVTPDYEETDSEREILGIRVVPFTVEKAGRAL